MAEHVRDLTRRRVLAAAAIAAPALIGRRAFATAGAGGGWSRQAYEAAMAQSGRPVTLSDAAFNAIQARKPAAMKRIAEYLKEHFGSVDPAVIAAFEQVPREYYHFNYADRVATPSEAYEEVPKPWAIGFGSALSDYLGQAYMTQLCKPKPDEVTLEIGTGSGFQSSVLSRMVKRAYSIEIIEPLGHAVGKIFAPLGYDNIESRVGDGYFGWPEVQGGFDVIIVTCAAQYAPPELFKQLKPSGRLIIPIGQPFKRGQILYVYTKDEDGKIHSRRDVGVFFIPMTGAMMKLPHPPAQVQANAAPAAPATTPTAGGAPAGAQPGAAPGPGTAPSTPGAASTPGAPSK